MSISFLTQPQGVATTPGSPYSIGASVTGQEGVAVGAFSAAFSVAGYENCKVLELASNGSIYVGTGSTAGTDSDFWVSKDNGASFSLAQNGGGSYAEGTAFYRRANGTIITGEGNNPTGSLAVKGNNTAWDSLGGVPFVTCFKTFANGNMISLTGSSDSTNATARVRLILNGDSAFSTLLQTTTPTLNRYESAVLCDATTALVVDMYGKVYRTTDSGVTMSSTPVYTFGNGTTRGYFVLGQIDATTFILGNENTGTWKKTTDKGTNWADYTTPPTYFPRRHIRYWGSGAITCGSVGKNVQYSTDGGLSWSAVQVVGDATTNVYDTVLSGGYLMAATGGGANLGKVYRATFTMGGGSTDFKLYKEPSTLIDAKTETGSEYQYSDTADVSDNGDYYITATNAGTTIQSNTITVSVAYNLDVTIDPQAINVIPDQSVVCSAFPTGGSGNYTYLWDLDGVTVSTAAVFTRAFGLIDNGKTLTCTVSDGLSPDASDSALVTVNDTSMFRDHMIKFTGPESAAAISCTIENPIKSTIELAMRSVDLINGERRWRDLGYNYDTFTTEIDRLTCSPTAAASVEAHVSQPEQFFLSSYEGIHPFSPLLEYSGDVRLVLAEFKARGQQDAGAEANQYSLSASRPADPIVIMQGSVTACQQGRSSCIIADVPFPLPDSFSTDLNREQNGLPLHGGGFGCLDRNPYPYQELCTVKADMDLEGARALLYQLVRVVRDNTTTMTTPERSAPFGQRYDGATSYIVGLASSTIEIEQNLDRFVVVFKLQLKGVA